MDTNNSLVGLADKLITETAKFVDIIKTEEDLRVNFEKILDPNT